jgi:chromosome segregation ATPase
LAREFQRLSSETSQHILSVANKCWAIAWNASASGLHDENARLRKRVEGLERDLTASTDFIAQIEGQRDERDRSLSAIAKEKIEFVRVQANLQSALRNAESDLRAAQRVIDAFERN